MNAGVRRPRYEVISISYLYCRSYLLTTALRLVCCTTGYRERYYRHVQTSVLEVLKKYGSDPVLLFWKAYGILWKVRTMECSTICTCMYIINYVRVCNPSHSQYKGAADMETDYLTQICTHAHRVTIK